MKIVGSSKNNKTITHFIKSGAFEMICSNSAKESLLSSSKSASSIV